MIDYQFTADWIGSESDTNDPVLSFHPVSFGLSEHLKLDKAVHNGISPLFRKEFSIESPVKSATAYVCGLGFFELYINGRRPDDRVLMPPKTDYSYHVIYEIFDLTEIIRQGKNCIGVILGNGWFNASPNFWGWQYQWYGRPRLIFELDIEYKNGLHSKISSDKSWKTSPSPIQNSCIYAGEHYDARLEKPGWNIAGFDDNQWSHANILKAPWLKRDRNKGKHFIPNKIPSSRVVKTIEPIEEWRSTSGCWVYDFGINFTGWVKIKVKLPKGSRVTLKYSEEIDDNGNIDTHSLRTKVCDTYIASGSGVEIWEPKFTWHGFRYVQISGISNKSDIKNLYGRIVHNDMNKRGTFSCDDEFVNNFHNCILRGQLSNLQCGVPIDCPQRDERLGWLGDAHITCEEASLNFDMESFYQKWLCDIRSQQAADGCISHIAPRPGIEKPGDTVWGAALFIIPWEVWQETGNIEIISENFESMKRYFSYLEEQSENYILPPGKYGDHLSANDKFKQHSGIPSNMYTAYFYRSAIVCSSIASVLGFNNEAKYYQETANNIKNAFNKRFLHKGIYDNGSQTAFAIPISFGMTPEYQKQKVFQAFLKEIKKDSFHPTTGLIGTKHLASALNLIGRPDVFWKMLHVDGMPGWKHLLSGNRTTLPENWDQTGSQNHIALGSVDYWLYRTLAGINRIEESPGYKKVHFSPFFPEELNQVTCSIKTTNGTIAISWQRKRKDIDVALTVPDGVEFTVNFPSNVRLLEVCSKFITIS